MNLPDTHHVVEVLDSEGVVETTTMPYTTLDEALRMRDDRQHEYPNCVVVILEVGLDVNGDSATETWVKFRSY